MNLKTKKMNLHKTSKNYTCNSLRTFKNKKMKKVKKQSSIISNLSVNFIILPQTIYYGILYKKLKIIKIKIIEKLKTKIII